MCGVPGIFSQPLLSQPLAPPSLSVNKTGGFLTLERKTIRIELKPQSSGLVSLGCDSFGACVELCMDRKEGRPKDQVIDTEQKKETLRNWEWGRLCGSVS